MVCRTSLGWRQGMSGGDNLILAVNRAQRLIITSPVAVELGRFSINVAQALEVFGAHRELKRLLETLRDVGMVLQEQQFLSIGDSKLTR